MLSLKKYLYALAMFCGTVIGVGLFGLPYVASKVGFIPLLFYFAFLGFLAIIATLMYGEMISKTPGRHRLPGYAEIYLGKKAKFIASISQILGITGALLAYNILGGKFLADLLIPYLGGLEILYLIIYFLTGAWLIYLSNKVVAKTELIMLVFFFIVIGLLIYRASPQISLQHFTGFNLKYLFLPYGVVLFSVWGASIVPEVKEILSPQHSKLLKPVIIWGTIISIITYILFVIAILGVTGQSTTVDALSGIKNCFSDGVIILFLIFGILTTLTSYISLGLTLKKVFWYDLKLPHFFSWLLVVIIPATLYVLGVNNFIIIISLVGAITLGIDTIITFLSFLRAKKIGQKKSPYHLTISPSVVYFLTSLFLLGIVLELIMIRYH